MTSNAASHVLKTKKVFCCCIVLSYRIGANKRVGETSVSGGLGFLRTILTRPSNDGIPGECHHCNASDTRSNLAVWHDTMMAAIWQTRCIASSRGWEGDRPTPTSLRARNNTTNNPYGSPVAPILVPHSCCPPPNPACWCPYGDARPNTWGYTQKRNGNKHKQQEITKRKQEIATTHANICWLQVSVV